MLGFRKSPVDKPPRQISVNLLNAFDSDTESDRTNTIAPASRTSSEPIPVTRGYGNDFFRRGASASSLYPSSNKQKRDFGNLSVQQLENYAVNHAEKTTKSVNSCLKIAADIRQDATKTLDTLHHQGKQIHWTHVVAADMDRDLSRGEKLLNDLGGMFYKPWKPKKTKTITGPLTSKDDNNRGKRSTPKQREKLGLVALAPKMHGSQTPCPEPTSALQKVELEKAKQDDALSDLSNILGDLKGMVVDMGSELDRQNKALDHLHDDVNELNSRVKGGNRRAHHLIGK